MVATIIFLPSVTLGVGTSKVARTFLPLNAMIAYLEKHDFEYWHSQINEWIIEQTDTSTDLKWTKDEVLEKISFDEIAMLQSNHLRINNQNVMLNHFWIYLH